MDRRISHRVDVICEYEFLDFFYKLKFDNSLDTDVLKYLVVVRDLFEKKSNLYIDFDPFDKFKNNDLIHTLFKSGALNFMKMPTKEELGKCSSLLSFVKKDPINKTYQGVPLTFDSENWVERIKPLADEISIKIHPGKTINEFTGWEFVERLTIPINSAIIIDRYAFKYETLIIENLTKILNCLVPNELDSEFDLTIFTDEVEALNDGKLKSCITKVFNGLHKKCKLNLSIYFSKKHMSTHDRKIVTNYYVITSGNSFDYYNNNQINLDTRVTLTPILYRNDLLIELQVLRVFSTKYKARVSGRNRLLMRE